MQNSTENTMSTEKTANTRITCEETHRLLATIENSGLKVWCKYHKRAELIPKEQCMAAWAKGQSVQCTGENDDTASKTVA